MDNRIRKNEICTVGLPSCDFVFSSTRSCFIAYGFKESPLEMSIIRNILERNRIQAIEAGGHTTPGQNAFCAKICSKIITSQFCIALLNNDVEDEKEIPNANVNMEYGLMLGFNKYVIPFQKVEQKLPFNVAGLDTIKYTNTNLEEKVEKIIIEAIESTRQKMEIATAPSDQYINTFLLTKNLFISPIDSDGERNLYRLGESVGFNLAVDFPGMKYTYLGKFSSLRADVIIWKVKKLIEIINGRSQTTEQRIKLLGGGAEDLSASVMIFDSITILVIVTSDNDKEIIENKLKYIESKYTIGIVSLPQIDNELSMLNEK